MQKNAHYTVLCFDFGTKRIGICYGSSLSQQGQIVGEIPAKDGIPDWQQIQKLIEEYQPNKLLTGLPLNMDGSENEMCARARKFARRLHGRYGLPSLMWDERLSSDEAKRLAPSDNYKRDAVDALAACMILESWFENGAPENFT